MKRLLTTSTAVALFCWLISGAALAQSSKATAQLTTVTMCETSSNLAPCTALGSQNIPAGIWHSVMSTTIKTSNVADLFADTSLVTGLFTSTQVKGNGSGSTSSATAMGSVQVRVVLDPQFDGSGNVIGGRYGYPDDQGSGVTFDQRIQTLSANLGNIFTDCFANGGATRTGLALTQEKTSPAFCTTQAPRVHFIMLYTRPRPHTPLRQAEVHTHTNDPN